MRFSFMGLLMGCVLAATGCGDSSGAYDVEIIVVSDYVPGVQFNKVRVDVFEGEDEEGTPILTKTKSASSGNYRAGVSFDRALDLRRGDYVFKATLISDPGNDEEPEVVAEQETYVIVAEDRIRAESGDGEPVGLSDEALKLQVLQDPKIPAVALRTPPGDPSDQVRALSYGSAAQLFRFAVGYFIPAFGNDDKGNPCPSMKNVDGVLVIQAGDADRVGCTVASSGYTFYGRMDIKGATPVAEPFEASASLPASTYTYADSTVTFKRFEVDSPRTCDGARTKPDIIYLDGTASFDGSNASLKFKMEDFSFEYRTFFQYACGEDDQVVSRGKVLSYEGKVTNWGGWNPAAPGTVWSGTGLISVIGFGAAAVTTEGETKAACIGPPEGAGGSTTITATPDVVKLVYDGCGATPPAVPEPPKAVWSINGEPQEERITGVSM